VRWLAGLALLAAIVVPAAASSAASRAAVGSQSVLVLLATWGPQPWTPADAEEAVTGAAGFVRKSSFGQLSLRATVTPWLKGYPQAPVCPPPEHERIPAALTAGPRAAADAAGFPVDSYDRVVYVVPQFECQWRGVGVGREVMLNGILSSWAIVHELGHTYGLAHARARVCQNGRCRSDEYGDPLSPMGHGFVDFGAFEKITLGWIRDAVATATRAGSYEVGRPDVPAAAPPALVVPTALGDFWFEQRLDSDPAGLVARIVLADIPDDDLAPPTLFIENPIHSGRSTIIAGEVFREPGVLSVRYEPAAGGRATLLFGWIDRVRPATPRLTAPQRAAAGRRIAVTWTSSDAGSGIESCALSIDGRPVTTGGAKGKAIVGPLSRGEHRISAACVDRAGNRSRVGSIRIRVRR
jgi:Gametolysin peptidase M11